MIAAVRYKHRNAFKWLGDNDWSLMGCAHAVLINVLVEMSRRGIEARVLEVLCLIQQRNEKKLILC